MTLRTLAVTLAAAAGLALGARAISQPEMPKMSKDDMVKMMQQQAAPAPEHKLLEPLAGAWKIESKFLFPGMDPMSAKGTSKNGWILGNRFMKLDGQCNAGDLPATEHLSILGYDTRTKKFTIWGIDTMGTYSISAQGDYDSATKSFALLGENEEPGMGKIPFKWVLRIDAPDKHTHEIHFNYPGMGWTKMVEIVATRG